MTLKTQHWRLPTFWPSGISFRFMSSKQPWVIRLAAEAMKSLLTRPGPPHSFGLTRNPMSPPGPMVREGIVRSVELTFALGARHQILAPRFSSTDAGISCGACLVITLFEKAANLKR